MIVLLLKVTVLLALALASRPVLRRSTAATRHLICAFALCGALLLPLTLLAPQAGAFRIDTSFVYSAGGAGKASARHWSVMRVWALGSLVLLLRIATGYLLLARLLLKAAPQESSGSVQVYLADIAVPVVSGLTRPVILLPRSAAAWTTTQWNAALSHELEHVRRRDLWTMLAGHLACAVYWFIPLVWLVAARAREEQESACDDAVLAGGFDPASYADALVAAARNVTSTRLIGCHMLTNETLKSRIARLFDDGLARISSRSSLRGAAILSIAAILAVGAIAGDDRVYRISDGVLPPKVLSKVNPKYTREARAKKVSGTVQLNMVVGADGLAHQLTVVRGLPLGLNEKAIDAVQKWHFQPGTLDGEPVNVRATIEINFRLK